MLVCSLMITAGSLSAQVISELPPFERAIAVIKHFEGLHNKAEHYPYYPKSNIIQSVNYTHLNHNKIKG